MNSEMAYPLNAKKRKTMTCNPKLQAALYSVHMYTLRGFNKHQQLMESVRYFT